MNHCTKKHEIPIDQHFAALIFTSINIPGDERSRTNPGHGYPARNRPIVEYISFSNAEEMQTWVKAAYARGNKDFVIIGASPRAVVETVEVFVE